MSLSPTLVVVTSPALTRAQSQRVLRSVPRELTKSGLVEAFNLSERSEAEFATQVQELSARFPKSLVLVVFAPSMFSAKELSRIVEQEILGEADLTYFDSKRCVRPDFSRERLRGQDYLGSVLAIRGSYLLQSGGFASTAAPLQKLEFTLRASRQGARIAHSSLKLCREFDVSPSQLSLSLEQELRDIIENHLHQTGGGDIVGLASSTLYPTRRAVRGAPKVSIVIPSRGNWSSGDGTRHSYLLEAAKSILQGTSYLLFDITVVLDSGADREIVRELEQLLGDRLRVVWWSAPFNFSQKMNLGVVHSEGDYVLLLNDDVQVISPDWIERLLSLAQLPNAGLVGGMLYFGDETIQHAGHAYINGMPTHIGLGVPRGAAGPLHGLQVEREVIGVTAACALLSREVFMLAGGFTSLLPGGFNDVDLALKVSALGFDNYWTPFAELYHFESKSRNAQVHLWELDLIHHRWADKLRRNPFWPWPPSAAS